MKVTAGSLDKAAAYKLLTGIVVPRPIAWVSTLSPNGLSNIAPFSCYTFVSSDPPMVGFNCGRRDGIHKDTARNIHASGEFVVNAVDETCLATMHASAADFPPDTSEFEALGLEVERSDLVKPLRVQQSPVSMECVLRQVTSYGRSGSEFIVGEVMLFHIREDLLKGGKIDSDDLRPLGRLAGPVYGKIGEIIRLEKA